jgi:ribonucleoside-diphosphate reductase alpha chain
LEVIVEKLKDMRFEPHGMTDDSDISEATSVMDYLARRLALDFLPTDKRRELGVQTFDDQVAELTS